MSSYYAKHKKRYVPEFDDGQTKQSFKDSCDINTILKKAAVKGGLSHVQKYPEAVYGEFDPELDLFAARERLARADEIFSSLPAEVRREFSNDALAFVEFANSLAPGELVEKIPAIAQPGDFFPNPVKAGQPTSTPPIGGNTVSPSQIASNETSSPDSAPSSESDQKEA